MFNIQRVHQAFSSPDSDPQPDPDNDPKFDHDHKRYHKHRKKHFQKSRVPQAEVWQNKLIGKNSKNFINIVDFLGGHAFG